MQQVNISACVYSFLPKNLLTVKIKRSDLIVFIFVWPVHYLTISCITGLTLYKHSIFQNQRYIYLIANT